MIRCTLWNISVKSAFSFLFWCCSTVSILAFLVLWRHEWLIWEELGGDCGGHVFIWFLYIYMRSQVYDVTSNDCHFFGSNSAQPLEIGGRF